MKVYITQQIPQAGLTLLKKNGFDVDIYKEDQAIPRKEFFNRIKDCDALISLLT